MRRRLTFTPCGINLRDFRNEPFIRLDGLRECDCIGSMKTKIFIGLLGALVVITGCVGTVGGGSTMGTPLAKDKLEGIYERPLEECFSAAKSVISTMGVLNKEEILHETNLVKVAEGRINERNVWVRVEAADPPKFTLVTVQARTSGGRADIETVHQVEKNIALKLVR